MQLVIDTRLDKYDNRNMSALEESANIFPSIKKKKSQSKKFCVKYMPDTFQSMPVTEIKRSELYLYNPTYINIPCKTGHLEFSK